MWAAIGAIASGVFATSWQGHPPGVIFLPLALAAWAAGHLFLWISRWLAAAGRRRLEGDGRTPSWPPSLALTIAGTGLVTAGGLPMMARMLIERDLTPNAWNAILLGVWLAHAVCFPALLLRLPWSRWLAAVIAASWALLLVSQMFTTDDPRPWELVVAILLVAALAALAARLAAADRVRRALSGARA